MKKRLVFGLVLATFSVTAAHAQVTSSTQHSTSAMAFDAQIATDDLIAGLIGVELPGDLGWHPANNDNLDRLPAFTDGSGVRTQTNLTGLLADVAGAGDPLGVPVKRVQYNFTASDISEIRILSGNNLNPDGRVFMTAVIAYSTDNGSNFTDLGYFQSDLSGTGNDAGNSWRSTLVTIFDNTNPVLLTGVTNLQFNFYPVSNTALRMQDPFNGTNPFTGVDDGFAPAFESPLIWEIDVIAADSTAAAPEPATLPLLALGGFGVAAWYRRRK
ncbi:MAG: hypothetical protein OHK0029_25050 [Armatimonadaceae bacterium]